MNYGEGNGTRESEHVQEAVRFHNMTRKDLFKELSTDIGSNIISTTDIKEFME